MLSVLTFLEDKTFKNFECGIVDNLPVISFPGLSSHRPRDTRSLTKQLTIYMNYEFITCVFIVIYFK